MLFFTSWDYGEGLTQSCTLPNLKIIQQVRKEGIAFLVTEEKDLQKISPSFIQQVNEQLKEYRIQWIPRQYHRAGVKKMMLMVKEWFFFYFFAKRNKVTYFHALCTPAGVNAYMVSKYSKAGNLIIDSFEPHTMYMLESGVWEKTSKAYRFLRRMEERMARNAQALIANTKGMIEFSKKNYGVADVGKFLIRPACVDMTLFHFSMHTRKQMRQLIGVTDEIKVCVYVGKFGGTYFYKETFDFMKAAYDYWKGSFSLLLLSSHSEDEITNLCKASGFPRNNVFLKKAMHSEVPGYLCAGDFAITPVIPTPSKLYCTPVKDGEYWAVGLPVVIPAGISDDSEIIKLQHAGVVVENWNEEGFKNAFEQMDSLLQEDLFTQRMRIRKIAEQYRSFDIAWNVYHNVYA